MAAYGEYPLTVECWVLIRSGWADNFIVANGNKKALDGWQLFSRVKGTLDWQHGYFGVLLPGCQPGAVFSKRNIADGQWHYVAMIMEEDRVRLYVDGEEVASQKIRRDEPAKHSPGPFMLGNVPWQEKRKGTDGLIGEVRLSRGVRPMAGIPDGPLTVDEQTIGLWSLDAVDENGNLADGSKLNNPLKINPVVRVSMDEMDRRSFQAGPAPMDSEAVTVALEKGTTDHPAGVTVISLDGEWQMAEGGEAGSRLSGEWSDAIPAQVPGSVHTALVQAGKIPDPTFGRNGEIARKESFKTWWFKRTFKIPEDLDSATLRFDGVAVKCTVWLNGKELGSHDGMFGGPDFDVAGILQKDNTLIVKIEPAPGDPAKWNNPGWKETVVFNNVYGWHYCSLPSLGIWRPVMIETAPAVRMVDPFVATRDAAKGEMDLMVEMAGPEAGWSGLLSGTIKPENFEGESFNFTTEVTSPTAGKKVHLRFSVPSPQLWWPNGMGDPNIYRLQLSFQPGEGKPADFRQTTFGIRTIEMAPQPDGPRSDHYNWTFVVNGKPMFVKGTGWSTMDPLMDFSRERYDRLLKLAKQQHIQLLRAWGSGMPETDDFYDLCNRYGIMVMQEWPTAWDSHKVQPYDLLEETVRRNTLRLRNNPSLVMWGGGNESGDPHGEVIDMMGRYSIELDGTRPFHRGQPWGGSLHNYDVYWGRQSLDRNLHLESIFLGEFGLASMPVYESVLRYLPDEEKGAWPPPEDGVLILHTPTFKYDKDWQLLSHYSGYFTEPTDLRIFVEGSQMAQAVGVRHTLELARTRWPECTGAVYYKLNDNYPAASWSVVDWYGAPKIGFYVIQNAFAPLHACLIFESLDNRGQAVSWPVYLLDDSGELAGQNWKVNVRAYDGQLQAVKQESFSGTGAIKAPLALGDFTLDAKQTDTVPLLIVVDVIKGDALAGRSFYFLNYETVKGSMFKLPRTTLSMEAKDGQAFVTNTGALPAAGVAVLRPGHLDTFTASDNYFWLEPGESKTVVVSSTEGLEISAWNLEK